MPFLVFVWGFISAALPHIVVGVLRALGISFIAYQGFDLLFSEIESIVISHFSGIGSAFSLAGLAGFGVFIKMILAAYSASILIKVATGGMSKVKFGGTTQ